MRRSKRLQTSVNQRQAASDSSQRQRGSEREAGNEQTRDGHTDLEALVGLDSDPFSNRAVAAPALEVGPRAATESHPARDRGSEG